MFAYANGNPVNMIDPTGHAADSVGDGGGSDLKRLIDIAPQGSVTWDGASGVATATIGGVPVHFNIKDYTVQDNHIMLTQDQFDGAYQTALAVQQFRSGAAVASYVQRHPPKLVPAVLTLEVVVGLAGITGPIEQEAEPTAAPATPPSLNSATAATFANGQYQAQVLTADMTAYRTYGGTSLPQGAWYGTQMPSTAAQAEQLYNIATYENQLTNVNTVIIPKGTPVYVGPVAGGTGTQIYIPGWQTAGIQVIQTDTLPFPTQ